MQIKYLKCEDYDRYGDFSNDYIEITANEFIEFFTLYKDYISEDNDDDFFRRVIFDFSTTSTLLVRYALV